MHSNVKSNHNIRDYISSYKAGTTNCPPFKFTPLRNAKNECYVNSSLYALLSNDSLVDFLYGLSQFPQNDFASLPVISFMVGAICAVIQGCLHEWGTSRRKAEIIEFVLGYKTQDQQDVGEFVNGLLERMDEELIGFVGTHVEEDDGWSIATKKKAVKIKKSGITKSVISSIFGCQLTFTVTKYNNLNSFEIQKLFILQLPVSNSVSLEQSLEDFLSNEKSRGKGNPQFGSSLHSLSNTLIIQLMVTQFSYRGTVKYVKKVKFPVDMVLGGYTLRLVAVQFHRGLSASHGHYVTVIDSHGGWMLCSDNSVKEGVDIYAHDLGTPYLLYYSRF